MRSFIIFGCIALAVAQRPFYAGSSAKGYPELASRFKDTSDSETSDSLANRIGEDEPKVPAKIPIDARGDADLVNRLNTWPRENRPFWLLNAEAIEKHRDPEGSRDKQQQQEVRSRSSFSDFEDYPLVEAKLVRPVNPRPLYLSYLG